MYSVGIIGGGGYTAGELIRILQWHPLVEIDFVYSQSQAGKPVYAVHEDLAGESELVFTGTFRTDVDVLFLCSGHGKSKAWIAAHDIPTDTLVIDLSNDFRLDGSFVYGLPELNREAIRSHKRVANPGCFATAIQLGLLPAAKAGLLGSEVHVHAITGSTGAGQAPTATTHFSWRSNNLSIYKAFSHQHLDEINRSLVQLQPAQATEVVFLPVRGDFARGIFASLYFDTEWTEAELVAAYAAYYADHTFTHAVIDNPNLKQVVNTNKCLVHVAKHGRRALVVSVIDNLLKGASGQAVQNMNLALGIDEATGLRLKGVGF